MIESSINSEVSIKGADKTISPYLWLIFFLCFFGNILGGTGTKLMSVRLNALMGSLVIVPGGFSNSLLIFSFVFLTGLLFILFSKK
jgi:hypothetical protein